MIVKLKRKFYLFIFIWLCVLFLVESPNLGLMIYSYSSENIQNYPVGLHNGFIGSTLVEYSITPLINSTDNVYGYSVSAISISFAGVLLLFLPIIFYLYIYIPKKIEVDCNVDKR